MIKLTSFIYVLATCAYFVIGDGAIREWQGFNIVMMLAGTASFAALRLSNKPLTADEKVWLLYIIGFVGFRALFTVICIFAPKHWIHVIVPYYTLFATLSYILIAANSIASSE